MECFIWSVGMVTKPQYSNCQRALTKVAAFVTIIHDIYDVYGTLDELELFTYAVERFVQNFKFNNTQLIYIIIVR